MTINTNLVCDVFDSVVFIVIDFGRAAKGFDDHRSGDLLRNATRCSTGGACERVKSAFKTGNAAELTVVGRVPEASVLPRVGSERNGRAF